MSGSFALSSSSAIPSAFTFKPPTTLELNTYILKGDCVVFDRTQALARVIFSEEYTAQYKSKAYCFTYKGLPVWDIADTPKGFVYQNALTIKSNYITLESKEGCVEISEEDPDSSLEKPNKYYIDTQKIEGKFYRWLCFQPKIIPAELHLRKVKSFLQNNSQFTLIWAGFNQYGTLACGNNKEMQGFTTFLWADPQAEKLEAIQDVSDQDLSLQDYDAVEFIANRNLQIKITRLTKSVIQFSLNLTVLEPLVRASAPTLSPLRKEGLAECGYLFSVFGSILC